ALSHAPETARARRHAAGGAHRQARCERGRGLSRHDLGQRRRAAVWHAARDPGDRRGDPAGLRAGARQAALTPGLPLRAAIAHPVRMSAPLRTLHVSETPAAADDPRVLAFARLVGVVDRLRGENGCPWDKKQTVATMAKYLVEEAYEALEAVERKTDADVAEECGDLLMVIALLARIAQDGQRFDIGTVSHGVSDKLVRRHPHVFGEVVAKDAETVLANWESIKQ